MAGDARGAADATGLGDADLEQIRRRGVTRDEVERQLALLRNPPPPVELVAPATPGDGIERIAPGDERLLEALWEGAARAGRLRKLVPASGAASRMFATLTRALESDDDLRLASVRGRAAAGDATARDVARFAARLSELPFRGALAEAAPDAVAAVERGDASADVRPVLAALLRPEGLGYGGLAKGLIPFHRRDGRAVTPVGEHLDEAALLVRDGGGTLRVHFTVAEGAEEAFRRAAAIGLEASGVAGSDDRLELHLSTQSPATDTVALDADGRPFRTEDGALLFRPGGHGALLRNLQELDGDLVLVKNIDNVQPADRRDASIRWQRLLTGLLVQLQQEARELLERLADERDQYAVADASRFVRRWLDRESRAKTEAKEGPRGGGDDAAARRELGARLDRPLRVAGMVPVTGEPGGGPFWERGRAGATTKQIVETAEIAKTPEQRAILDASTHFNPVLMVLAVRDRHDRPYRLQDFVDPTRVFITERTSGGETLHALEHPGLWNGSMSGWNTVFVEIPQEAFTPVKTVLDLLRDEHRSSG
jgi:hypothetical protein